MASGYDSIFDIDQTTSMFSVISQNAKPAEEKKSTSRCAEVEFCIIKEN